jgi:hypothetical protein
MMSFQSGNQLNKFGLTLPKFFAFFLLYTKYTNIEVKD